MRSLLMIRVHWDVIYDRAPLPFDIFLNGAFEDDDMPRYVAAESGSLTLSLSLSVSSPHPRQLTSQGLTQPKPRQPRFCVLPFPSSSSAFEIPPGPRDATKLPEQTNRKKDTRVVSAPPMGLERWWRWRFNNGVCNWTRPKRPSLSPGPR